VARAFCKVRQKAAGEAASGDRRHWTAGPESRCSTLTASLPGSRHAPGSSCSTSAAEAPRLASASSSVETSDLKLEEDEVIFRSFTDC